MMERDDFVPVRNRPGQHGRAPLHWRYGLPATYGLMRRLVLALCCGIAAFVLPGAAPVVAAEAGGSKIALVIGNGAYAGVGELSNPVNDATDVAAKLRQLGFDVTLRTDADYLTMRRALTDFGRQVKEGSVVLFYYAGHGMQVRGKNYLLPVDARIQIENDVGTEAMDVDFLLDKLSPARLSVVILDACRNNPFERRFRGGSGAGLAHMAAPTGTLIAYSTAPGKVAADGEGRNGLYTGELLKAMSVPGLQVEDVFKQVRSSVVKLSGDTQTPWEASSLTGSFYFIAQATASLPSAKGAPSGEELLWAQLDEKRPCEYAVYLERYPKGRYAKLARFRLTDCVPETPRLAASPSVAVPAREAPKPPATATLTMKETAAATAAPGSPPEAGEDAAWAQAERANTLAAYQDYLRSYPDGSYAAQARSQLARLKRAEAKKSLGKVIKDCEICPELVEIPAGRFEMGSSHGAPVERPVHDVVIRRGFALGRTEVTQGQWNAIMGSNPSRFSSCGDTCPVENVSWADVQIFLQRLNAKSGQQYRLPSEAEWEYAARAGTSSHYSWGDDLGQNNANCDGCGSAWDKRSTAPAASFAPNGFGLYDMHGNVAEWVADCWNEDYDGAPEDGSAWADEDCTDHVLRGGSWGQSPRFIRAATRNWGTPAKRVDTRGFRIARSL